MAKTVFFLDIVDTTVANQIHIYTNTYRYVPWAGEWKSMC